MRIVYMITSLGIGGAERQVLALAERMAARGHDVLLVVLRPQEGTEFSTQLELAHLEMTRFPLAVMRGLLRARNVLRQFKPELLHSHTFPANMAARLLHMVGAAPKVIVTIHNVYEGGWARTLAYRLTDPLCIHTTAVSQAVADRYVQTRAVPRHKCSAISNGIDTEVFAPTTDKALREGSSRCEPQGFVWLAAGRDVPAKDFANLLAAFKLVCKEEPRARLRIAGDSRKRQAGPDGELDQVRWLGLCDDMPATIASTDAFVLSSAWEGMPLVVGEAMAMGKPVVATDVGGVRELVADAGVLVPPRDPEALATAMLRVIRMPDAEFCEIGKTARARIVKHFDIDAKAREWEALYLGLLDNQVQPAATAPH